MSAAAHGRIGPNAITRVAEALPTFVGVERTVQLFAAAGLSTYLVTPPQATVDESEVTGLHVALHAALGAELAGRVARDAGTRTADYLLARRIPKLLQGLLKRLPAAWAARVLLAAIGRHAWTFVGSGAFSADTAAGRSARLTIRHNPLCRGLHSATPACDFYAAVFERLFRVLVQCHARAHELCCEASGAGAFCIELRW